MAELSWKAFPKVYIIYITVLQISEQLVNVPFMPLQNSVDSFARHKKETKTANPRNGMVGRGRIQPWSSCLEG